MKKIKILIATHKKYEMPKEKIYLPIHVGAEGKNDLGYQKDNEGENISKKNSNFCELTGLYWAWKNLKTDYIGMVHYRRYFFEKISNNTEKIITPKRWEELLEKYDIILPTKTYVLSKNAYEYYKKYHKINDLIECGKIIEELYPDYSESFNKVINSKSLYHFNMFAMKKKNFDEYAKWLFDILFELEKRIDISKYDNYNKRVYGFLSERLFNVWIRNHKEFKIKELPVCNIENKLHKEHLINIANRILLKTTGGNK